MENILLNVVETIANIFAVNPPTVAWLPIKSPKECIFPNKAGDT